MKRPGRTTTVAIPLFVSLLFLCGIAGPGPEPTERYSSVALPTGETDLAKREFISTTVFHDGDTVRYHYSVEGPDFEEDFRIVTDATASVRSAVRHYRKPGEDRLDSLWTEGQTLYAYRLKDGKIEDKTFDLPRDRPLAVDASLMLLFRQFPFDTGEEMRVFMVDFSQRKVDVTVRQKDVETISVPAGDFECYRLEVSVKVLFLRPKINFWVSKSPPHFLVRHEGKRGPFTKTYRTELTAVGGAD